ncbi:hypothetical protein Tco_0426160, partial [Tanacetum coccineum]
CIRQTCNDDVDAETIVKYLEVLKDEHIKPGDAALSMLLEIVSYLKLQSG